MKRIIALFGLTFLLTGCEFNNANKALSVEAKQIQETFVSLPKDIIKSSISRIGENEEINYHFEKEILKNNVTNYLNEALFNKVKTYKISFFYYLEQNGDLKVDLSKYPKNCQIHFYANSGTNEKIEEYLVYQIGDQKK
jgi:PBP1b-binding outer membrane lipoprotein LpoB